jgi:hypothetical protein
MILSLLLGITLFIIPWWSGFIVLIIFTVAKSLLLPLLVTYQKPIDMKVLESMSSEKHSMMPVIIIQEILHTGMRVIVLAIAYFIFLHF